MYARVNDATDVVEAVWDQPLPGGGPPAPPPEPEPGITYYLLAEPIDWSGRPSDTAVMRWNEGAPAWAEVATMAELRAAKSQQINNWKLEANSTYFDFAGEQIAYRDSDRIEIQAVHNWVTLTGTMPTWPDWPGAWKAISNRWVPLPDVATWEAFTLAIAERGTAHFKRAQQLKAAVAAAATPAEIEAITW